MGLDFLGVENTYGLLLVHYLPSRMFFSELVPAILVVQQKQQQNKYLLDFVNCRSWWCRLRHDIALMSLHVAVIGVSRLTPILRFVWKTGWEPIERMNVASFPRWSSWLLPLQIKLLHHPRELLSRAGSRLSSRHCCLGAVVTTKLPPPPPGLGSLRSRKRSTRRSVAYRMVA